METIPQVSDANQVKVYIPDKTKPITILVGPKGCGKTMTIISMFHYLRGKGYALQPCRAFRGDAHYQQLCDDFLDKAYSDQIPSATEIMDFMLYEVRDEHTHLVNYILDTGGENYFDELNSDAVFPRYLHVILTSENPKRWAFYVSEKSEFATRRLYIDRIRCSCLSHFFTKKDKAIFIYPKIDNTNFDNPELLKNTTVAIRRHIDNLYPGLLKLFSKEILWGWMVLSFYTIIPYSAGTFLPDKYIINPKTFSYQKLLWDAIRQ